MEFLDKPTCIKLAAALTTAGYEFESQFKHCPENDEINFGEYVMVYPLDNYPDRVKTWLALPPAFTMCELWPMVAGQMILSNNPRPTAEIAARALWLCENGYPLGLPKRKRK